MKEGQVVVSLALGRAGNEICVTSVELLNRRTSLRAADRDGRVYSSYGLGRRTQRWTATRTWEGVAVGNRGVGVCCI